MIIIVEGPDGVGKSTLVAELAAARPYATVMHHGPPEGDVFELWEQSITKAPSDHIIADRWHWGEPIYGPLLRGVDKLGLAGWRHVELTLLAYGVLMVYVDQPLEVLQQRVGSRGDDLVTTNILGTIQRGYGQLLAETALPTLVSRGAGQLNAEQIYAAASVLTHWPVGGTYIGSPRPEVLLVGDKRGGEPPHADDVCFVPRRTSSGKYLLEALPEALWRRVGIANANETDIPSLWRLVGQPPIVALGREAAKSLETDGLKHSAVPHPQFVRRFYAQWQVEYGDLIHEAALGAMVDLINPFDFQSAVRERRMMQ